MTYHNLANLYAKQGRQNEAIQWYLKALEINPKYARAYNDLGNALVAIGHFREALRLEPGFAEAHESLISALIEQGKTEEASRQFQLMRRLVKAQGVATKDGAR